MTTRRILLVVVAGIVPCSVGVSGCVLGPASIAAGRGVYNEVINRTEDEQLLNMIVKDRYDETYGMLAVASVTANISASADVRGEFGLTRTTSEDYQGNLVPLAGGVAYEENPTISYVPLGGEKFIQSLLSPIGLEEISLMSQYLPRRYGLTLGICVKSINGLRNPRAGGHNRGSPKFDRVDQLFRQLRDAGVERSAHYPDGRFVVIFSPESADDERDVIELLDLVGIAQRPTDGRLVVPISATPAGSQENAFSLETLSVMEVLRAAGTSIEIPAEHLEDGVVEPVADAHEGQFMRIRTARTRPNGAGTIAINYRGYWYYVDDADPDSKQAFLFLRILVGLRLYDHGKNAAAPVLTIPVG